MYTAFGYNNHIHNEHFVFKDFHSFFDYQHKGTAVN